MEKIELNKLTIELLAPDLLLLTLKEGITIEKEDVLEVKKHNLAITKGNNYAIVFDSGHFTSVSKQARELMTSAEIENKRIASAFVINSLSQKILGNFYLKVNKPNVPTKLFSDKGKAIIWIKEELKKA
ncbi:MAG: hypothetical protein P8Q14_10445 [Vicingaceae bacterium]|nr:hypothetical protein [Vicingaceae bacterium]